MEDKINVVYGIEKDEDWLKLTPAEQYIAGYGNHKIGDRGYSIQQINNALESFADSAGLVYDELCDYIAGIPEK